MADISDALSALVALIAQVVYPNGTGQASIINTDVRVFAGWPAVNGLDKDLAAGKVQISVYTRDDETNTTRFPSDWAQPAPTPIPTIGITTTATTATIGGTVSGGTNVGIRCNHKAYVYTTQAGDTLTGIAAALATLINADTPATSSGAVITIPGAFDLVGRVGTVATVVREVGRSKRSVQICFWCSSDAQRSALVKAIDPQLRARTVLTMPDGTGAQLAYMASPYGGMSAEATLKATLYGRDLIYSVELSAVEVDSAAVVLFTELDLSGGPAGAETPIKTIVE